MHQKLTENANVFNVDIVTFDKLFNVSLTIIKSEFLYTNILKGHFSSTQFNI